MKRNILFASLIACTALTLVACGKDSQPKKNGISEEIFLKIDTANTQDALMEHNSRVAYNAKSTYANGDSITAYMYQDQEKYVYEEDGYLFLDLSGKTIIHEEETNRYEMALYVGEGAYEQEQADWPLSWFVYDPTEKIVSVVEENGLILIRTECISPQVMQPAAETYGYDPDDVEKMSMYYEVNSKNHELNRLVSEFVLKNGSSATCLQVDRSSDPEDYMIPENIIRSINTSDTRTITLVENPETAQEITFEYEVPFGYHPYCVFSQEYEAIVYADADFTAKIASNTLDSTSNIIGYIRKAK